MAKKILVIDDHQQTANLVSVILKREGYRVFTENSGAAGIETAKKEIPNLILLDVMMPDMDGLETCRRIRKLSTIKHVPVILFTAKDQADEKWEGFQAGATEVRCGGGAFAPHWSRSDFDKVYCKWSSVTYSISLAKP